MFEEARDCSTIYYCSYSNSKSSLMVEEILCDLRMEHMNNTEIFVDNHATIVISHNPMFHGKTKHFNIKLFFLREVQKNG